MKLAILGDTHFGARGDSIHFHELYATFYKKTFFPYLKENDIDTVYQLGDLFDRRKYINFHTLHLSRKYFFDTLKSNGIRFVTLLGNHDVAFKNTLQVNSPTMLLKEYDNITVLDSPKTVIEDGVNIDIIPWMCKENEQEIREFIKNSNSQICFGHFELAGFEMDRGNICHEGMDRGDLSKYDAVLSGHFHHKSSNGNICYVGAPIEITWADCDDDRGFHVFDTETRELEFIPNPHKMFNKIYYNDQKYPAKKMLKMDFSKYKNKMVKVIVEEKTDAYSFDKFIDALYNESPVEITVVEDFTDYSNPETVDDLDQSEDTVSILNKYIDSMEFDANKDKLKNYVRDIYNVAHDLETR